MAVKAKKRKLATTARQDQDVKVPQNNEEAELQRQEEEMLAMTRLLKRVDTKDALTVAKKILESSTVTSDIEEGIEVVNGATPTPTSNGSTSRPNMISADRSSNDQQSGQTRATRLRQAIATNVTPSSPVRESKYATRETRSKTTAAIPLPAAKVTTATTTTTTITTTTTTTTTTGTTVSPSLNTNGSALTNGPDSTNCSAPSSEGLDSETWLADLTIANIQKQNDAHEQEDQRLKYKADASIAVVNGSAEGPVASTSKHSFVSVLRSGRHRVPLLESSDSADIGQSDSKQGQPGTFSVSVKSAPSVKSDTSTSFMASVISDPSQSADLNTLSNFSVTFKAEGENDSGTVKAPGFEIPISALIQPRLTKTLIQQKARSTYAPPTVNQPEQPRRKPGRPPGYFLGPTSCAYCRAQHRRCDFNTVCIRCIKAKIPCDRSGTVDRPTIIVREARQQAKAEAAAALAAAVAAGLAIAPEKPQRPSNRYSQLHALTMEAASITSRLSSPPEESIPTAGTKRRRSPSPSDVSRGNIIEQKIKRVASVKPIQKYDPSTFLKQHSKIDSQNGRKLNGESSKRHNRGYLSSTDATSAGTPSGNTSDAGPSSSSAGQKRKLGRPSTKDEASIKLALKRAVGRPPNSSKYTSNTSIVPKTKFKRKPGRPPKSLSGDSTSSLVPSKRGRNSSKSVRGKTPQSKNSKGKQVAGDTEEDEESDATVDEQKPAIRLVRKMYLKSGLYSADLKVNPTNNSKLSVTLKQASKQASKQKQSSKALVSQSKRRVNGSSHSSPFFQLPINYGSVLMSTEKDFTLPFDIMQAWQAGLLRKSIQPEPFIKIRSNIFLERKRRTETSPMVCHCTPPPKGAGRVGCGEDCYNRVMFYECISAHCPCGDQCSNQRFQRKHNEDNLRVIWTQERGFGIQTLAPIKKGNLVIEYRGEVISQSECHRRMETIYKNNKNFYFLEYEKGEVVDACQKGTNARFVNHSCSPNSQIEKWFLNGEMSIGIFASQDIPSGAEISYDYNFSSFSGAQKQKCRCGAPNCRGYIGERISKSKEPAIVPASQSSGRSGKKADARKRKAGRRKVNDQEPNSIRLTQMPSVRQIRQRQSNKYKEDKMAAIRYTKLFLFRNIRLVESKYIKYARTKSRSYQETVSRTWLQQARQCRKRSLEGVVDDLRAAAKEQKEEEIREQREESESIVDSEPSVSVTAEENSIVLEVDADDADAMDEYDEENYEDEEDEEEIDELDEDNYAGNVIVEDELEEDELEEEEPEIYEIIDDEEDELKSESE
ncbi:Histone-Lysine N-Methyltransferase ash1l [Haplosporangium sp. Z 27]|nr:Histone-Lysine N-Methyltransferase ash1l [Haplosporangium sp. Z 27]